MTFQAILQLQMIGIMALLAGEIDMATTGSFLLSVQTHMSGKTKHRKLESSQHSETPLRQR